MTDTIYALATPPGRSGVAVIRVSGPEALSGLERLTDRGNLPPARQAALRTLRHPISRETIDQSLIFLFKRPASYTGEDVVEYHIHGSRAVVAELFAVFSSFAGYRPAGPGEFTRRAFENGRLDLTEAEAIADLIDAETQAQRLQALAQMGGALSLLYEGWRERLVRGLAHMEADLDFPEEDLPAGLPEALRPEIDALIRDIRVHLDDSRRGERLREGIRVVVLGPPNAGKSTLVNVLVRREVAIVSDLPGTTRDLIEVPLDIAGYPVLLSDTAGLRSTEAENPGTGHEVIEKEGIRRALVHASTADIRIFLFDGAALPALDPETLALAGTGENDLLVLNKTDQGLAPPQRIKGTPPILISARTGEGIDGLLAALAEILHRLYAPRETPSLTRARHRSALEECHAALCRAKGAPLPELAAEDLRLATRSLGQITGRVDVEDLLDVIFRDFCIGK